MAAQFRTKADSKTVPVTPVETEVFDAWLKTEPAEIRSWVASSGFKAKSGQISLVAGKGGALARVLLGVEAHDGLWDYAGLPTTLPAGSYRIDARMSAGGATSACIGWALGCYQFDRYKSSKAATPAALVWPKNADKARVEAFAGSIFLVRDLINTPAEDMGPTQLAAAARALGRQYKAAVKVITGDALLKQNTKRRG